MIKINKMKIMGLTYNTHLILGVVIRLILIIYGELQDSISVVPYTDIDYKVVTDGARHILNFETPFKRHTFRYTPLLAIALLPNVWLHKCFGKLLFAIADIVVALIIKAIIRSELSWTFLENAQAVKEKFNLKSKKNIVVPQKYEAIAANCSLLWLYNPLAIVISTRGNGDSITSLFVLASMYFLLKPGNKEMHFLWAGVFHGIAIHFRLYPIVFSLAYYLYLSNIQIRRPFDFVRAVVFINVKQLWLITGTVLSFSILTLTFYNYYGYQFLFETYIFHLVRKDIRHNFSLYFYMQYLNAEMVMSLVEKVLTFLPQFLILLGLAYTFAGNRKMLPFCIFLQAFTVVAFNPVLTSQYFIWFLSLFPLCAKNFKRVGWLRGVRYFTIWGLAKGSWLIAAYLLEFEGWNTFMFIWSQAIMFFSVNVFIMERLVKSFEVIADFKK